MLNLNDPNALANVIFGLIILGAVISGFVAKTKGLITFGKPVERRQCAKTMCGEHPNLMSKVEGLERRQQEVKGDIGVIKTDIGSIKDSLAGINGYILGKNGVKIGMG